MDAWMMYCDYMFLILMYDLISLYFFCSPPENRTPPENINMSDTVDRDIDIIENNRPKPRSCVKFPCGICNKSVKNNHKACQCDSCDLWIHIVCNDISDA